MDKGDEQRKRQQNTEGETFISKNKVGMRETNRKRQKESEGLRLVLRAMEGLLTQESEIQGRAEGEWLQKASPGTVRTELRGDQRT